MYSYRLTGAIRDREGNESEAPIAVSGRGGFPSTVSSAILSFDLAAHAIGLGLALGTRLPRDNHMDA